jgi:hypothetical protein
VDGQVSTIFNGVTGVRRDIPLQPDQLKAATPAQPRPAPRPAAGAPAQGAGARRHAAAAIAAVTRVSRGPAWAAPVAMPY